MIWYGIMGGDWSYRTCYDFGEAFFQIYRVGRPSRSTSNGTLVLVSAGHSRFMYMNIRWVRNPLNFVDERASMNPSGEESIKISGSGIGCGTRASCTSHSGGEMT